MYRIRPARGIWLFSMLIGIVFVLLGFFIVIPIFRLFGIFWTIVAACITIYHGMNVFSRKGGSLLIVEKKERRDIK